MMNKMWKKFRWMFASLSIVMSMALSPLWALEPFDNWANPPGSYAIIYPITYGAADYLDKDGNVLLQGLDIRQSGVIARATYYQDKPISCILSAYAPLVRISAHNVFTNENESDTGLGDVTLVGGWFFVDDKVKNTYVALGFKLDMPTGSYDQNKFANLGKNVWRYRPLIAFAKLAGPFDLEAHLTHAHETVNKDKDLQAGDQLVLESYAGMFLSRQLMVGLHYNTTSAQNNELSGVELTDSAVKTSSAGPSVLYMMNPRFNVMLEYLQDFGVRNTTKGSLILARLGYKI
jgi:hypothetical protein